MSAFHSKVSPHVSSVVPISNLTYKPNTRNIQVIRGIFKVITLCLIKTLIITLCTLTFQTQTYAAQIQTTQIQTTQILQGGGTPSTAETGRTRTKRSWWSSTLGYIWSGVKAAAGLAPKVLPGGTTASTVASVVASALGSGSQSSDTQATQTQQPEPQTSTAKTVGYSLLGVLAAALTGFAIFAIVKWGR